jgi:hypothetical protein
MNEAQYGIDGYREVANGWNSMQCITC